MPADLNQRVASFYDAASGLWEEVWGEHMHQGFYGLDGRASKDPYQAQVDLIEALLGWGQVQKARMILDVGCGIGGASFYLLTKLNAQFVTGMTLSASQAFRARERAAELRFAKHSRFDVADALQPPYAPNQFDLVWLLEAAEHIADKAALMQACHRMAAPNGKLLMGVWCRRETPPNLSSAEQKILDKLMTAFAGASYEPLSTYAELATSAGFKEVSTADWTQAVAPFWWEVAKSGLRWKSLRGLWRAGMPTMKAAWAMQHLIRGYRNGVLRFCVLQATK